MPRGGRRLQGRRSLKETAKVICGATPPRALPGRAYGAAPLSGRKSRVDRPDAPARRASSAVRLRQVGQRLPEEEIALNNKINHRIVVGVDGSPSGDAALRWAVRQAEVTGSSVDAVIAWEYPIMASGYGVAPVPMYGDLDFGALAVGSRGHGGFVGALLSSVSQHCVQHAPYPVVVMRGAAGSG